MPGETIVFFVKFTTLPGVASPGAEHFSDPFDVTAYKSVVVEDYNAGVTGTTTVTLQAEQSSDLETWSDKGTSLSPTVGAVASTSFSDPARYIRLRATVVGANGTVTLWAKAVARDA